MTASQTTTSTPHRGRPVATWVLRGCSLAAALFLLDWTGEGLRKPYGFFALPAVLGLAGAGLALLRRREGWAMISGLWGVVVVPVLVAAVTVLAGP